MNKLETLLIELGTEELPPKSLRKLAQAFADNLESQLNEAQFEFKELCWFASPRRLAIQVQNLSFQQPDQLIERKGPKLTAAYDAEGKPSKALQGFMRSCGAELTDLQDDGEKVVFSQQSKGKALPDVLPEMVSAALNKLPVNKPMRWGNYDTQFIRPVHWLVMLYGKDVISGEVLGLKADRVSYGHRFHHPEAIKLNSADDYLKTLETKGMVIADYQQRQAMITEQVTHIAAENNATAKLDQALLDEVTSIVEYPVAVLGQINPEFLVVPKEALISAMQEHQKSFALLDKAGNLKPYFITISNIKSKQPEAVQHGNEKVMRARLEDAAFFYHGDCKTPLSDRLAKLDNVVFQEKLGSLKSKTERVAKLAVFIAGLLNADMEKTERAALLSKADLLTDMVGEFPELQGIMGRYYAKHDGEPDEIAEALEQYYWPRHAGDNLPETDLACAVALADRIDTIMGIFSVGLIPTGDKDPYALRRAALGVLRIIIDKQYELDLSTLLNVSVQQFDHQFDVEPVKAQVLEFIMLRLKSWYQEQGVTPEQFEAVFQLNLSEPYDFDRRINAVRRFCDLPEAQTLAAANKRVVNLLKKTELEQSQITIKPDLLAEQAERQLAEALTQQQQTVQKPFENKQYTEVLAQLATLHHPIDDFFDNVMVLTDDSAIRENRLALLLSLRQLFLQVADISLLPQKTA